MDFDLSDEQRAIVEAVRDFVRREVMPLEAEMMRRERAGQPEFPPDELAELRQKARRSGLWGIATPEEYGGADLDAMTQALVTIELARTFVPFSFSDADHNILL